MNHDSRITLNPNVMGGKPCVRGLRMTVGTIVGLLATGSSEDEILVAYPYLERDDIRAAPVSYTHLDVYKRQLLSDCE